MGLLDRFRRRTAPRVAVVGIDGLPYSVVADNPSVFENLRAIGEAGAGGPIDSAVPPAERVCWPALTTGVNPGKTGVYGFTDREVGSYETYVPMGGDVQADHVWDHVAGADRDATVLNVPVTHPPQRDVQRMVSGYLAGDLESAAYPDALREQLLSMDYRLDNDPELGHEDTPAFIEDAAATLEGRFEAFRHYVEVDDWDLFFGVFTTTDRLNHFLFGDYERHGEYREEFLDVYRTVDQYVGDLHDLLPEDVTTVVVSDHGFAALDHEVRCNRWLEEEGWLSYRTEDPDELADIADDARAYSLSSGRFYLNLEGREPRGSVPPSEYEAVRAELRGAIEGLRGPDGEAVVERVIAGEEVFSGPHDDLAPDLVAVPRRGYDLQAVFGTDRSVFDRGTRTGMHTYDDAALFVDDPAVEIGEGTDLYDVVPTLLDLLELDTPGEFDGRSLA